MLSLTVKLRQLRGKKSENLRKEKILPGVVYGKEVGNLLIEIPYVDFRKIYQEAGESVIINLTIKKAADDKNQLAEKEYPVLIRETQKDPVTLEIIHVDFYQIPTDKEIEMVIPLEFIGSAPAEKELGGILIKNIHEIRVKALPKNIIHSIKVELSSLRTLEDRIRIKDLNIPQGIKILISGDEIVALAGEFKEEKIEEAPAEMKLEEVEVVKKEKKVKEGEEVEVEGTEEKGKPKEKEKEKPKEKEKKGKRI